MKWNCLARHIIMNKETAVHTYNALHVCTAVSLLMHAIKHWEKSNI